MPQSGGLRKADDLTSPPSERPTLDGVGSQGLAKRLHLPRSAKTPTPLEVPATLYTPRGRAKLTPPEVGHAYTTWGNSTAVHPPQSSDAYTSNPTPQL